MIAEKFAGEGSGMTSRKSIDWKTGEDIKFTVSGQYDAVNRVPNNFSDLQRYFVRPNFRLF